MASITHVLLAFNLFLDNTVCFFNIHIILVSYEFSKN